MIIRRIKWHQGNSQKIRDYKKVLGVGDEDGNNLVDNGDVNGNDDDNMQPFASSQPVLQESSIVIQRIKSDDKSLMVSLIATNSSS